MPGAILRSEIDGGGLAKEARASLERAQDLITDAQRGKHAQIHELRRCITRARSLLRLARKADESADFRGLDRALRNASRRLSGSRDRHVAAKSARRLSSKVGARERRVLLEVSAQLAATDPPREIGPIGAVLVRAADEVPRALMSLSERDLRSALERSIRAARRSRRDAQHDPSDESVHRLRRRTRNLRNQIECMGAGSDADPKGRLVALTKKLGELHDLAVLRDAIRSGPWDRDPAGEDAARLVQQWIDRKTTKALTRGKKTLDRLAQGDV